MDVKMNGIDATDELILIPSSAGGYVITDRMFGFLLYINWYDEKLHHL